jgi:hypothetical protein
LPGINPIAATFPHYKEKTMSLSRKSTDTAKLKNKIYVNQQADNTVAALESADIGSIFVLSLQDTWALFLESTAKYFLFPVATLTTAIRAIIAWREVALQHGKGITVPAAIVETLAALAIGIAVVGTLVFNTVFAAISPIIFAAVIGAKSLFSLGVSFYFTVKAFSTDNSTLKSDYTKQAVAAGISALSGLLLTVAIVFTMSLAKSAFAVFGIVAGVLGLGLALYKVNQTLKPVRNQYEFVVTDAVSSPLTQNSSTYHCQNSLNKTLAHPKFEGTNVKVSSTSELDSDQQNTFIPDNESKNASKDALVSAQPAMASLSWGGFSK